MRALAFVLTLAVLLIAPLPVDAAPAPDPPLTYRLTVYDRDPRALAPEGTRVAVYAPPPARQSMGLPPHTGPCAEAVVDRHGHAEFAVELTAECPAGLIVSFLMWPPGGPITAASEPPIVWRKAYSEATTTVDLVVRPIPPWTSADPGSSPPRAGALLDLFDVLTPNVTY